MRMRGDECEKIKILWWRTLQLVNKWIWAWNIPVNDNIAVAVASNAFAIPIVEVTNLMSYRKYWNVRNSAFMFPAILFLFRFFGYFSFKSNVVKKMHPEFNFLTSESKSTYVPDIYAQTYCWHKLHYLARFRCVYK